jgi:hypothetical protein
MVGPRDTMCYGTYISTDSPDDLTLRNSELIRFERVSNLNADPCTRLLDFPNKWYVGSKSICSCTFRHLYSVELGFGEPEEWFPEEQDNINATKELYEALKSMLSSGHHIDLMDRWEGAQPEDITTLDVALADVPEKAFRLFENHKFRLKKGKIQP